MPTVKLTLSADEATVQDAKELARERHTSVSAMFARLVGASRRGRQEVSVPLGPLTQRALGLVRLPEGASDGDLMAEALGGKYEMDK